MMEAGAVRPVADRLPRLLVAYAARPTRRARCGTPIRSSRSIATAPINQFWSGYKGPITQASGKPSRPNTSWCRCAPPSPRARRRRRRRRARPSDGRAATSADSLRWLRRHSVRHARSCRAPLLPRWSRGRGPSRPGSSRLFDWKPFLVFVCLLPAVGLLLTFLDLSARARHLARLHRHHDRPQRSWVGLENFEYLFEDKLFWQAVFFSVFYTAVATVGKFGLGLWLALLLNNHLPFKSILRAIILLPWIVPTVLSAIAFWWIYDPQFSIISYIFVDVLGVARHLYRLPRQRPGRRAGR